MPLDLASFSLAIGHPSLTQLSIANRYRPKGMPEYTAEELITIPLVASDNLISRSNGAWDIESLESMARLFAGRPVELNHNWDEVEKTVAKVYDAQIIKSAAAPDGLLGEGTIRDRNLGIVAKSGFAQLVLHAFVEATHPIVNELRYARLGDISTGGFTDGTYICPLCDVSFDDPTCPHFIPDPVTLFWLEISGEDFNPELIAPYYIRSGFCDAVEVSFVLCGNLPGARVPREGD